MHDCRFEHPEIIFLSSRSIQDSLYSCESEGVDYFPVLNMDQGYNTSSLRFSLIYEGSHFTFFNVSQAIDLMVVDALVGAYDYLEISSYIHDPSKYWKVWVLL